MSSEGRRREKWQLLRKLLSIRPSTSHQGSCIENIFWKVATVEGDYQTTIKPGLFVLINSVSVDLYTLYLEKAVGKRAFK